jgi:anaerobic selenocysteine-containing dehydrogenase
VVSLYADATYREMDSGMQQSFGVLRPTKVSRQKVPSAPAIANGRGFRLMASRGLYTSYEGAAVHSPDADKLHREEHVALNPEDGSRLGVEEGGQVFLRNSLGELRTRAHFTNAVAPGTAHVPLYLDGGVVGELFDGDEGVTAVDISSA